MSNLSPDLILYNANVITLDSQNSRAELVAVKNGKIIWVGRNKDLVKTARQPPLLLDCKGKTVIPGFNDAHLHILASASNLLNLDLSPSNVSSIPDIQSKVHQRAKVVPKGKWIKGVTYNEFYLAEKRHPNRWDIDLAAPDHPVKIVHRSLHACVLNSLALKITNISTETQEPDGILVDRSLETGEPTGILFGAISALKNSSLSWEELKVGVKLLNEKFLSFGITSLQDATEHNDLRHWETFQNLKNEGILAPRVNMMLNIDTLSEIRERGLFFGFGDDELRLGAIKLSVDETRGKLSPSQSELNEMVLLAHKSNFQVAIHAIEENTVAAAITALENALTQSPKPNHRHRLEHCSECPPNLLERLKKVNAFVVTQPSFIYYSGERYISQVESSKLRWLYRTGSFSQNGLGPAASSDSPVTSLNPMVGIYAATTRKTENHQVLLPEEAVSVEEALKMYTLNGAYASFEEKLKGSISVGKLADLVVLSADPTKVNNEELKNIKVEKTIIDGKVFWERD